MECIIQQKGWLYRALLILSSIHWSATWLCFITSLVHQFAVDSLSLRGEGGGFSGEGTESQRLYCLEVQIYNKSSTQIFSGSPAGRSRYLVLDSFGLDYTSLTTRCLFWSPNMPNLVLQPELFPKPCSGSSQCSPGPLTQCKVVTLLGLPLTSSLLLEYSSEYLSEYSSTR